MVSPQMYVEEFNVCPKPRASQKNLITDRDVSSTNLVIILGMMQVSKKIPFDDPQVLMGVRGLYIVSNLLILGVYFYLQMKINSKKGTGLVCALHWQGCINRSRSNDTEVR